MENENQRTSERFESLNLLSYVSIDSDGKEWNQGMGRTLNISETGIKLETHEPIETRYVVLLSIGIEEDLVDLKGKVIYCNRGSEGRFESGIHFDEMDPGILSVLRRFIRAFENQPG